MIDSPERPSLSCRPCIGPYQLVRPLGRGGMACVFLGLDPRRSGIHRLVAVKTLREGLAGDVDHREMFADEATIASQISHPNVCRVFDHGVEEGRPYLVMEYVCGETLRSIQQRTSEEEARSAAGISLALQVLIGACQGLHAVHELRAVDGRPLDAVHRDVTPDNIIVACNGTVKLLDFGIVKSEERRQETQEGLIKGKLAYLAPEVLDEDAQVDRRADIWALGVIAWEIITGERLFKRDRDVETLQALISHRIEAPSTRSPVVPPALDRVVLRALSRDPEERFGTVRELALELRRCADALGTVDRLGLQSWLRRRFDHDPSCLQRTLQGAGHEPSRSEFVDDFFDRTPSAPSVLGGRGTVAPSQRAGGSSSSWWRYLAVGAAAMVGAGLGLGATIWLVAEPEARAAPTSSASTPNPTLVAKPSAKPFELQVVDEEGETILVLPIEKLLADQGPRPAPAAAPAPSASASSDEAEDTPPAKPPSRPVGWRRWPMPSAAAASPDSSASSATPAPRVGNVEF